MDKRVIYAVAGSGKTTYIVNSLSDQKRSLIITYTNGNYANLHKKVCAKFNGKWPKNITLLTYFSFLYGFCYKPFLSDKVKAKGLLYEANPNMYAKQDQLQYYLSKGRYLYSNRLSLLLDKLQVLEDVKSRIKTYFDELIIDEVQDVAGRDFSFLEQLMTIDIDMLFVGDFYQHTFDTSRDGNINKSLYNDKAANEARFTSKGFSIDNATLKNSWRCSKNICDYIRNNIGIDIYSNRPDTDNTSIKFVSDLDIIGRILDDKQIVKLHYQNGSKAGIGHKNWGETKGEDHYQDICVLLNETTAGKRRADKLFELPPSTKNRLYVAITRARGNVYLIDE
jgi:DNA helicase-2/ATP-dependent DNA helicase PcrA